MPTHQGASSAPALLCAIAQAAVVEACSTCQAVLSARLPTAHVDDQRKTRVSRALCELSQQGISCSNLPYILSSMQSMSMDTDRCSAYAQCAHLLSMQLRSATQLRATCDWLTQACNKQHIPDQHRAPVTPSGTSLQLFQTVVPVGSHNRAFLRHTFQTRPYLCSKSTARLLPGPCRAVAADTQCGKPHIWHTDARKRRKARAHASPNHAHAAGEACCERRCSTNSSIR